MSVKFLLSTLTILLATLTFFAQDTVADTETDSDKTGVLIFFLLIVLIVVCIGLTTRKERVFLKEHSNLLSSEDPKVLLELTEKCYEFLRDRQSDKVASLSRQAKAKIDDIFFRELDNLLLWSEDPKVLLGITEKCEEYLKDQQSGKVASLSRQAKAKMDDILLKELRDLLSSTDPKVLLELTEKCEEYLKDQQSDEVARLSRQAKAKAARIQKEIDLDTFKSEISEDGSHPAVVAKLKETMHNPDSFQHVSSDYEIVEKDGKFYHKIEMTFRGTNTFNALVLQTCYFIVDADNQIALVGFPDDTESSTIVTESSLIVTESSAVNTASLSESIDAAVDAVDGIATAADLLLFFTGE